MGSDYRIFKLMKELSKKDFGINYIVFPPLRALGGFVDESLTRYLSCREKIKKTETSKAVYLKVPTFIKKIWRTFLPLAFIVSLVFFYLQTIRLLRKTKPDAVIAAHPSYMCGLIGVIASRQLNIPVILDYPDLWTPMTIETLGLRYGSLESVLLERMEEVPVRFAKHIIVVSRIIQDRLVQKGISRERITIIPNGVSSKELLSAILVRHHHGFDNSNHAKVLFVGRLERWSGLNCLIKAVPIVTQVLPNTKFVIVGDGYYKKLLEDTVTSLGFQDSVLFMGFLSQERVWTNIRDADVCISIFSEGKTNDAAMPIKLLEYMALGKPVVATEVKGMNKFLKDRNNILLVNREPVAIATAILSLLKDSRFAREIGFNAKKMVEKHFDWEFLAEDFESICYYVVDSTNIKA